jgi:hypothetical protein
VVTVSLAPVFLIFIVDMVIIHDNEAEKERAEQSINDLLEQETLKQRRETAELWAKEAARIKGEQWLANQRAALPASMQSYQPITASTVVYQPPSADSGNDTVPNFPIPLSSNLN